MKLILGLLVIALGVGGAGSLAEAATPGTIDDGGSEPGHTSGDPGPGVEPEPKPTPAIGEAEAAPSSAPFFLPAGGTGARDTGPGHRIALVPRFAYRLGDAGRAVAPANGLALAGTYEVRYAHIGPLIEMAIGIDFAFDRFATDERGRCIGAFFGRKGCVGDLEGTFASTRVLSETSFVLVHTIAARAGRLRPYLTLGAGVGVGFFDSVQMDLQPGTAKDVHVLGRGTIGLDVPLGGRAWSATFRADYTAIRAVSPFVTDAGQTLPLFGDLFDIGVGVAFGF